MLNRLMRLMSSYWKEVETHDELEVLRIAGLVHYAGSDGCITPCSENLFDDNWEVFMHLCRGGFIYLVEEDNTDG
jgi:hypothetical protein